MGEIAQYLPVLSFRTGKKVVLVDSFRSDAVHHVVWDTLLFRPAIEDGDNEEKSSSAAWEENQDMKKVIKNVLEKS